jgi:small-conductance mechanosensitive channel
MTIAFDHILIARVLFTLATLGWAAVTVLADFNKTHATNPQWTPHARFHVVWQILSYVGFGLVALALIWWPGPYGAERLYFVALMGAVVYGAFFLALLTMSLYGGAAYDQNGYLPFKAPVPLFAKNWDLNITVFSGLVVILAAGTVAAAG